MVTEIQKNCNLNSSEKNNKDLYQAGITYTIKYI